MNELRFTLDHEWLRLDSNGLATVGITDYAQQQLGDVVFVELPQVGTAVTQHEEAAVVESVKAAGEVKSPVSGKVVEVNTLLADEPAKVNEDPGGDGWLFRLALADTREIDSLMDQAAYDEYVKGLG